ncbi:uncharacterized protein LOC111675292 [Lucilia cuprina]|uniref:uncharacterized protein LOC111675292 n=1 Tax=Lucilia cuprina TaxID=7375 RepID=UPI001F069A2E|nr:uncharacterized protein LOC111675292 [Lucilia cuprina]
MNISLALRDVRVQIPHAVRKGEKAILKCLYDLEGDSLYSVKWYKGRREFYSFTPKETPAMKVFQFAGVKIDRSSSNESQLVLETVNAATSGKYSCEVSADAPSFHTLIGAGELEVVVPGKDPVITGIRSRYKVGDIVRGNCTSSHSRPAANITWTVNGYETNPAHIRHFKPHKDPRELETVISAIHFVVTPQHFIYGKLKIRCTAFIHDVYWKSTEKSIEENRLNKAGSSNVVHKFSEDYFDLDEDNVVDRSDTYMTHIKGDVSSLNASGCSALHKCSCFWPRLTTLSLVVYAVQQMFQLLQQFLRQTTSNTATKNNNFQTIETHTKALIKNEKNVLKTKTISTTTTVIKQKLQHIGRSLATQVSTICYENNIPAKENKTIEKCWPKEKYFEIKLIKKKHVKQIQQALKLNEEKWQLPAKYVNTLRQKQLQLEQLQSQLLSQIQQECDKTLYESEYNLTMTTTQVANILPANIVTLTLVLNFLQYIFYKVFATHHNLYAQFCTTPPNNCSNGLNTATCLNTPTTTGNSTSKDFFVTATKQTTTTAKITITT